MKHDKIIGICLFYGYIIYKIEEKIGLLLYKIRRPKEEKILMNQYVEYIKRKKWFVK
jgi:hypothetical protein